MRGRFNVSIRIMVVAAAAGLTLAVVGATTAPAQVPHAGTTVVREARRPPDPVLELLRKEAEAKNAERLAMFARIDAIDKQPVAPRADATVRVENVQVALPKAGAVAVARDVAVVNAVPAIRLMPAMAKAVAPARPDQAKVVREQMQAQQKAQQAAMVNQWTSQIRPVLKMEYQFVRTVCDPPTEKRKPIARAGWVALHDASVKFVDWQFNRNGGIGPDGRYRNPQPEPRKIIRDAFLAAVKANLSEDDHLRYQKEIEARDDEAKRGAIMSLVTKLDSHLVLSAEQRDEITGSLSKNWDETWNYQQAYFNIDYAYFPMLPDKAIVPALNDSQKKVWAGTQKVNINSFNFGGLNQDAGPLDDEFPDEPVKGDSKEAEGNANANANAVVAPAPPKC